MQGCWSNVDQKMSVGTYPQIKNDLARAQNLIKMSLKLFQKVPPGAIETLFDD